MTDLTINMKTGIFLAVLFYAIGLILATSTVQAKTQEIFVIPVSGDVEPAMAAFIKRAFRDTVDSPDALFILEIDTFGGRIDSALEIVETLLAASPRKTIALVTNKAISAGALIALACNQLVMMPHTTIGGAAPIALTPEGPEMLGEKFQAPLRAKFRTLARHNNYPPTLAEAMVSAEMTVYKVVLDGETRYLDEHQFANLSSTEKERITSKKTVVPKGELLIMDDAEAYALGFSMMTVTGITDLLDKMNIENYQIIHLEPSWSENLGRVIISIAPILLMIGMGALYTELRAPGFGVFGIIGVLCLGLVFMNQYLVGLANYTELIIIVLGLVLLLVEFFVLPGFGVAGIAGFICIAIGMILSFQDFIIPDPSLPWQQGILTGNIIKVLASFVVAFLSSLLFVRYLLPRMGAIIDGPYLDTTLASSHADSEKSKEVQLADSGVAVTSLHPAGKMEINHQIIDVVTEGDFIEQGTTVVVTEIKGNLIIVQRQVK